MSMYLRGGLHGSCGSKQSTVSANGCLIRASSSRSAAALYTRAAQVSSSSTPAPVLARYFRIPGSSAAPAAPAAPAWISRRRVSRGPTPRIARLRDVSPFSVMTARERRPANSRRGRALGGWRLADEPLRSARVRSLYVRRPASAADGAEHERPLRGGGQAELRQGGNLSATIAELGVSNPVVP